MTNKIFSIVFISVLAICCSNKNSVYTLQIPELLDRPTELAGLEWQNVQNTYQSASQKINNKSSDASSYLEIAEIFMHEARVTGEHGHYYPSALEVMDYALNLKQLSDDHQFLLLINKASVLLSQHEFKEAQKLALEALKFNAYNAQVYGTLVDAYVELGEYDKAVLAADKMVSIRPDIRSYSRISYLRELHGDLPGAIEAMKLAAESGFPGLENRAWAKLTLGELYAKSGQMELAKKEFESILNERENYPFAIAALGKMQLDNNKYETAEALLKQAAGIIPEVGYYMDMAKLYKKTNRQKEFLKTIEEIDLMLLDDVNSGHNMNMEYADFYLNIKEESEDALNIALQEYNIRPKNCEVNKLLSKIYYSLGEQNKSMDHLNKALELNENSEDLQTLKSKLISMR